MTLSVECETLSSLQVIIRLISSKQHVFSPIPWSCDSNHGNGVTAGQVIGVTIGQVIGVTTGHVIGVTTDDETVGSGFL